MENFKISRYAPTASSCKEKKKLYLIGGRQSTKFHNKMTESIEVYDICKKKWSLINYKGDFWSVEVSGSV